MNVVGDEIIRIFHTGGISHDGIAVDRYAILLKSGRCIELMEHEVIACRHEEMMPDDTFEWANGMMIIAVETSECWPTVGLLLSGGRALVMGSPVPNYWGLYDVAVNST
jgi:RNA polymerase subunit RPABC4/transcription elongation factor Spt4